MKTSIRSKVLFVARAMEDAAGSKIAKFILRTSNLNNEMLSSIC